MSDNGAEPGRRTEGRDWLVLRYVKARPRMLASLAIFLVGGAALLALKLRPATAVLIAFDVAAVVFLGVMALLFNKATPGHMRSQAQALDTGRWGVLWSAVVLSAVVLVALSDELQAAKGGGLLALGIGVLSVILSWLFLNVMFAIHYAHGYYGNLGDKHAGLEFPDTPKPDYWDFAYFSIVIGMTFQVSDVQITSNYLRRVVLLHSVIAFFFNVFIIAITVNIVAGRGG
ncbi:DUF1345 domain-containing protein [Rhodanobacter sp. Col0626]|uniref:DUF1345 domain-containing protein n=1 Tax=Rhodanobacter sp. Col0626 TaxID=3415679 RepID=UPI003CEFC0CF